MGNWTLSLQRKASPQQEVLHWRREGTSFKAAHWIEGDHPRGSDGRFIRAGDTIDLPEGGTGRVVGLVGGARLAVEREDGKREIRSAREVSKSKDARKEALAKLNAMTVRNGNISLHQLGIRKATQRDVGFDFAAVHRRLLEELPPASNVDLATENLRTTQGWARKGTVEGYIENGHSGQVTAVRYRGKLIILDGNHRLAAALLQGRATLPIHVIDGDALSGR